MPEVKQKTRRHGPAAKAAYKEKYFRIGIKLESTKELFQLKNVYNEMKIKDVKAFAEFTTGIPANMQRLCYLDQGDLLDSSDIKSNDIVPGAQIVMKIWDMWKSLVEAVMSNDADAVFKLGVTKDTEYSTPNSQYMSRKNRAAWLAERAFVALYIASHRGQQRLCEKLIQAGANVNATTPMGRSSLHVAAAKGHGNIVDLLLEKGANINAEDSNGDTAMSIADKFGHKGCERHLFLFRWQERAKNNKTNVHHDMFAHQFFDSANPVWLNGGHAQIYYTQILPLGEFEGTAFNAPKRRARPGEESEHITKHQDSDEDSDAYYVPKSADEMQRGQNQSRKGMPPITEESLVSKSAKSNRKSRKKDKAASFDDWLVSKKKEEHIRLKLKKIEDEENKNMEEDKKRTTQIKDQSYDQWLASRKADQKKATSWGPSSMQNAPGTGATGNILQHAMNKHSRYLDGPPLWTQYGEENFYTELKMRMCGVCELASKAGT